MEKSVSPRQPLALLYLPSKCSVASLSEPVEGLKPSCPPWQEGVQVPVTTPQFLGLAPPEAKVNAREGVDRSRIASSERMGASGPSIQPFAKHVCLFARSAQQGWSTVLHTARVWINLPERHAKPKWELVNSPASIL